MDLQQLLLLVLIFILFSPQAGCDLVTRNDDSNEPGSFERRELPRELTEGETRVVNGSGHFGFNLMSKLIQDKPNDSHIISPLSILMAYGMTINGAEGDTYSQISNILGLENMSRDQINDSVRDLIELLESFDDQVQFNIANSIWHRDSFDVEADFIDTNRDYYQAVVESADFDDPETADRINDWVSEQTEGLIPKIVSKPIDPLTVFYLINAIYFQGDWTIPFDPEQTEAKPFYRPDGTTVETNMMHLDNEENMLYKQGEDYEAVNLYYSDAGFSMTLILPEEDTDFTEWIASLKWDEWTGITDGFSKVTLTLDVPKFEMQYEIEDFKSVLQELGMTDAFDPSLSDFSRINPDADDLHISDTKHKTFITVDEEGTEAAAATSIEGRTTSVPQSVQIRFDRPFLYVIREVESETILFMGTMTDPDS